MANRLNKPAVPTQKPPFRNLTNEFFRNMGTTQFHLGVLLQDGPCFLSGRDGAMWHEGYVRTQAYHEGYTAGIDGIAEANNPYLRGSPACTGTGNGILAADWLKGYRAAQVAFEN